MAYDREMISIQPLPTRSMKHFIFEETNSWKETLKEREQRQTSVSSAVNIGAKLLTHGDRQPD